VYDAVDAEAIVISRAGQLKTASRKKFYRNYQSRVRPKPGEDLWSLWFGSGDLVWGLVISPALRNSQWINDKSQMRRENYEYWTVGHVLETGLIDPESDEPITFKNLSDLIKFYNSVIKRTSKSRYEKSIAESYFKYLRESKSPMQEPFLIPELRYAGKEKKHEHRLDYTVLNPYSFNFIGFELSPASTHLKLEGVKGKTQKTLNQELSVQWESEAVKRNKYFDKYGISVVTFTDSSLKDIPNCFSKIQSILSEREESKPSIQASLLAINRLYSPES
jgi:hypothetical protein